MTAFFSRYKWAFVYGVALATILFFLQWLEWRFLIMDHSLGFYIGAIALVFTGLGIWLSQKLFSPRKETIIVEKEVFIRPLKQGQEPSTEVLNKFRLSRREWEVLKLVSEGLSNQEIASRLFVSMNTVKTHVSSLYLKLDVRRRTQAVEKAKSSGLLP